MRRLTTATLLLILPLTAGLAQERERVPAPERDRTYTFSFGPEDGPMRVMSTMRRGRLGVTVDMRPDAARDTVGALIAGVSPGGAADRAGVRAGDIVTRFNGTRLAGPAMSSEDPEDEQSRPALRLIRLASRLDPGDTVRLEVRRDGRLQTFTFASEESDMDMLVRRMSPLMNRIPDMAFGPEHMGPGGPNRIFVSVNGALEDLELVKNNAGLGENFGTAEGLVVINVGADSALGIRSGDVILAIGGRRPTTVAHAMRILSTYEPGEAIPFEVMRTRRRTTVSGRMPQRREGEWRVRRNSFELPLQPRMPWHDEHELPRMQLRAPRGRTIIHM